MVILSIIIPVYNRPQEVMELLSSLELQLTSSVEIIIVEDGSSVKCDKECQKLIENGVLKYFYQNNSGPGPARNLGAKEASGNYLLFLDSDCIIPQNFISQLLIKLKNNNLECWGGPDAAHESFTPLQKAINYSMTSVLTTGGIRGSKKSVDKFYPRSFNMGIRRNIFEQVNGFSNLRFGEDLDLSMRIIEAGYKTQLLDDQFVYHKRRNTFKSFFKQVFNSGKARINLNMRHPGSLKIVHTFPSLFAIGTFLGFAISIFFIPFLFITLLPAPLFFLHSLFQTKSLQIAFLAVIASYYQLFGYGIGFLNAFISRIILKKDEQYSFTKSFYK